MLILPWPNTPENVTATVEDLRANGSTAKIIKTQHETYVSTNASKIKSTRK